MTTEKARLAALLLQILITTAMLSTPTANAQKPKIVQFTLQNKLTYINDGSHVWNLTKEDASISLFLNNSWQTVAVEDVSHQIIEVDVDEDGNPIAYLNIEKWTLAPGENITIQVSYEITSMPRTLPEITLEASGTLKDIPERLKEEFCEDEGCWLTKNQTLRELAQNLTGHEENVLAIVCNFVSWINENIDYKSFDTPLYPNETYQLRQGDCDDQANLLITLCRIVGIPAYLQVGCVYVMGISEETTWSGHLELLEVNVGWHGWATVYIPPWGWLPVDLTYSDFPATQNPIDAITTAAATLQKTIILANITQSDYVADTRELKQFLIEHDFRIRNEDVMQIIRKPAIQEIAEFAYQILAATVAVGVIVLIWNLYKARRGVVIRPY